MNPKKKLEGKFMEKLQTNEKGEATYNGITLESSLGVLSAKSLKGVKIA